MHHDLHLLKKGQAWYLLVPHAYDRLEAWSRLHGAESGPTILRLGSCRG